MSTENTDQLETVRKEMKELVRRLEELQFLYYQGQALVDDAHYDQLQNRLEELEQQYPQFRDPNSPTSRVGSDLSSDLAEYPHSIPVLSLDKAYDGAGVQQWLQRCAKGLDHPPVLVGEEKMDGVSIVLYYEAGRLVRALSRGNGSVGNDVTANVRTIRTIPLVLPEGVDLVVRGEIFLPKEKFTEINAQLGELYSNPRNLAAGTLRRVKSSEVARVPLEIFCYEAFFTPALESHVQALARIRDYGFPLNPRIRIFAGESQDIQDQGFPRSRLEDLPVWLLECAQERQSRPYEIDGLVFKLDDLASREELGYTGHHPRWAIAFKFESPQGITVVDSIDIQVGRSGRITPVARVQPVTLAGATITNVTLHNKAYIEALELAPGDQVAVSRRGDVIPAVERVIEKRSPGVWAFPQDCPSCGSPLVQDGAHHFCRNPQCPDQIRGRLKFFTAKDQMDMENLGPETLDVLMARGWVKTIPDLFHIPYEELQGLPGFGEKKVQLIREGVDRARSRPLGRWLASLGIPELGPKVCELLLEAGYRSLESIQELLLREDPADLLAIHGIGEKTALALQQEFHRPENQELIRALVAEGLPTVSAGGEEGPRSSLWNGQKWCVTGSFEHFQPRSLAEEQIRLRGGTVQSGVSGQTTHLLAGEKAGSKLEKARQVGASILTETEFRQLLEQNPLS